MDGYEPTAVNATTRIMARIFRLEITFSLNPDHESLSLAGQKHIELLAGCHTRVIRVVRLNWEAGKFTPYASTRINENENGQSWDI